MGLRYATVIGVARDDLPDEGAWLYAETVRQIHAQVPGCGVELLIPDFNGYPGLLGQVFAAAPEVLAHNIETVPRIFRRIRPGFRYGRSLDVIRQARAAGLVTKSNLILGLGEERAEVSATLRDLHAAGCDRVTITQYLAHGSARRLRARRGRRRGRRREPGRAGGAERRGPPGGGPGSRRTARSSAPPSTTSRR
jgi:lipoic acid synthetase